MSCTLFFVLLLFRTHTLFRPAALSFQGGTWRDIGCYLYNARAEVPASTTINVTDDKGNRVEQNITENYYGVGWLFGAGSENNSTTSRWVRVPAEGFCLCTYVSPFGMGRFFTVAPSPETARPRFSGP